MKLSLFVNERRREDGQREGRKRRKDEWRERWRGIKGRRGKEWRKREGGFGKGGRDGGKEGRKNDWTGNKLKNETRKL